MIEDTGVSRLDAAVIHDESSLSEEPSTASDRISYTRALKGFLGKDLKVIIDRPIGFDHDGIIYTLNYGYIEKLMAPDGEYQDAYVLGVDEPIDSFEGKVIAIVNRKDDIEDKLVVSDGSRSYSKEEIRQEVDFQEKYLASEIITDDIL